MFLLVLVLGVDIFPLIHYSTMVIKVNDKMKKIIEKVKITLDFILNIVYNIIIKMN